MGAEYLDINIDHLNPGEIVSFSVYYAPFSDHNSTINDYYWGVCYNYRNHEKLTMNCKRNDEILPTSEGRMMDTMIPVTVTW